MIISFGGHEFLLHHSGALYWPSEKLLIASDLHLEKGSHFAGKGLFLPPYDSRETLSLLARVCSETGCEKLLLLGDAFHDPKGFERLEHTERNIFDTFLDYKPLWIRGNHDGNFIPEGFSAHDVYSLQGISFAHEAGDNPFEISGHYHPKVQIGPSGRPCFIEDGQKMILPAFGAYTGGLFIDHHAIAEKFRAPYRVYALGKNKVYFLSGN